MFGREAERRPHVEPGTNDTTAHTYHRERRDLETVHRERSIDVGIRLVLVALLGVQPSDPPCTVRDGPSYLLEL